MTSILDIHDIGSARRAAHEPAAGRRGLPIAEVARSLIDDGIARAQGQRDVRHGHDGLAPVLAMPQPVAIPADEHDAVVGPASAPRDEIVAGL